MTTLYSIWYNQNQRKATKNQNNNAHKGHPPSKKARISSIDLKDRIRGSLKPKNHFIKDINGANCELHSPFHLQYSAVCNKPGLFKTQT